MKIARIESFILGTGSSKDLLFCRVETEDGTLWLGRGLCHAGKETVIAECVEAMAPHVIGRGVFNIRHTGQIMFEDFAIRRSSMELMSAWSAIEIASWDIIGKICRTAGLQSDRRRRRASGCASTPMAGAGRSTIEEGVERGRKVKAMGFTAAKFDPFPGPWRSFVDRRDEDFAIDYVAGDARGAGAGFRDLGRGASPLCAAHAIRIGHRLAEFGIDWYEEPCLSENHRPASPRCGAPCRSRSSPARRSIRRSSSSNASRDAPPIS